MRICPQCGTRFEQPLQYCPNDGSQTYEALQEQAAPEDPLLGRVIDGRYRIEEQIGEGGMGIVYMATHTVLGKKLALKVLRGDNSKDPDVVQRFMQEAQSATSIGHQNIIDISDFGRLPDGSVYFVMEYLDGQSLSDLITKGGSVPTDEAIHIVRQMASALEGAHNRGIVHRDLKPDNIFVIPQGGDPLFVKVLDFGVAKVGGAASKLTKTGMVFGTPHYMSPEQAAGQSVDQRTDIYALGVIMYEMFTGKVPFDADTFMGILSKHMFEIPPPPTDVRGANLGGLENVILRSMEKNPDHRYQSMAELIADLDTISGGGTVTAGTRTAPPPGNLADALEPSMSRTNSPQYAPPAVQAVPSGGGGAGRFILVAAAAAFVLLLVGGTVGTVVFVLSDDDGGEAQAQAPDGEETPNADAPAEDPPVADTETDTEPETETETETPTPVAVAPAAPAPTAAPAEMITIESDPPGAEVLLDDIMVGNTPVRLPRPASGAQGVTLRLRDHEPSTIQISDATSAEVNVRLVPVRRAARPPPRRPVPTSPIIHGPVPVAATPPPPRPPPRRPTSEVVDPWAN